MDKAMKLVRQTQIHTYVASDMVCLSLTTDNRVIGRMIRGEAESFDENISAQMIKGVIHVKLVNKLNVYHKIIAQTRETMELHGVESITVEA